MVEWCFIVVRSWAACVETLRSYQMKPKTAVWCYSTELRWSRLIVCWITSAELESSSTNGHDDNTYPNLFLAWLAGSYPTLWAFMSFPAWDYQRNWSEAEQNEPIHLGHSPTVFSQTEWNQWKNGKKKPNKNHFPTHIYLCCINFTLLFCNTNLHYTECNKMLTAMFQHLV